MRKEILQEQITRWFVKVNKTQTVTFNDISSFIKHLNNITGKGLQDDPFNNTKDTLYRDFCSKLSAINHRYAIYGYKRFYEKCLELETKHDRRIHKADILYFIGESYRVLRVLNETFYFWLLSFLDDILSEFHRTTDVQGRILIKNALEAPVFNWLQLNFDIPFINLVELRNKALHTLRKEQDKVYSPEILKFKLRKAGYQTPRLIDYQAYHPDLSYIGFLYKEVEQKKNAKLWEQFAAFLLSSIEGFEPITNLKAGDGSYEFDTIIRNCAKRELFISSFGDYIGVECKYFQKKKVDVEALNHFAAKLNFHNMKTGIILSKTPISGWSNNKGEQYGKLVQTKIFNRNEIIIFDINSKDIEDRILKGMNLIEMLIEKYEKVRLGL